MATIEIILKNDIIGLGDEGDIKKVKAGYARNFLLPKGLAVRKTKTNLFILEKERAAIEARKAEKRSASQSVVEQLKDVVLNFTATVADNDKLYGSITSAHISEKLAEKGIEIDKRKIELEHPIKTLGEYDIKIKLYEGISATIKVIIEHD